MHLSIFEAGMLICFGISWPVSVYRSAKSKSTKGKSIIFLYFILVGYFSGITHKLIYSLDLVLILYIINSLLVITDICLYYRNRRLEKLEESNAV